MEIYVVTKNGCVSFISSTSEDIKAHVIDLDEPNTSNEELEVAENLTRIW